MPVLMVEITYVVPVYVPPQGAETRLAALTAASEIPHYEILDLDCDPAITVIREVRAADVSAFSLEGACPHGSNLTVEEILDVEGGKG